MNELIKWTNLTHKEIAIGLKNAGFCVSLPLVKQLLKKYGYVERKAQKKQITGINKNRNFQNFKILLDSIQSIDKRAIPLLVLIQKKEVLGNLYRPGTLYTTEPVNSVLS
jgi:hypothetical protein